MSADMTPSRAHDEAWRRSPDHDALQVSAFRWFSASPAASKLRWTPRYRKEPEIYERSYTIAEYALRCDGRISAFVDLVQIYQREEPHPVQKTVTRQVWFLHEIKPRIDTVGGLIRQCRTLDHHAEKALPRSNLGDCPEFRVIPLVPHDDPALPDLEAMWGGYIETWDLAAGCPRRVSKRAEGAR